MQGTSKLDISRLVTGEPVKCIVKVKPPISMQREDVKIVGGNVVLLDSNNRIAEEFDVGEAYGPTSTSQQIFESSLLPYMNAFIQGFNLSIFGFGGTGTGKSSLFEGTRSNPGLVTMMADSLFSLMENKKYQKTSGKGGSGPENFSYGIRVRFLEIIDEDITDLFYPARSRNDDRQLLVVTDEWEGPTVTNASWVSITNVNQLNELLANGIRNKNTASNEFGRLSAKSTSIFTLEVVQTTEYIELKDTNIVHSRLHFFDLPGSDILLEDSESVKLRQGLTMNKAILSLSQLVKDIGNRRGDYIYYETSTLTHLMKDVLGGNSLSVGIFTVQCSDLRSSSLTLNYLKYSRKIINFPVVNDGKVLGLLRKYRAELIQIGALAYGNTPAGGEKDALRLADLEKKLIESNLEKIRLADERTKLAQRLGDVREKYNDLVKNKADLQSELIRCEEEKLEISKALVELQIENTKLLEMVQNEKFDIGNKLLNAEGDVLSANLREQKLMEQVQELKEKINDMMEEKRELEVEFVALKKNYLNLLNDHEAEKAKNENIGIELINAVNENKTLHGDINKISKNAGSVTEEQAKILAKLERLERENYELKEALIGAKGENERFKTEVMKAQIEGQQYRLELDSKAIEMERGLVDMNRDKQTELGKLKRDAETINQRTQDNRLVWESERVDLISKTRALQRRIGEMEERMGELNKANEELRADNTRLNLQLDEMRSVYRNKLVIFMNEQQGGMGGRGAADLNAREELLRTYTEKEIDLQQRIDKQNATIKNVRLEVRALKTYARSLKYLAEDWAPVGVPLPDILTKQPPTTLDEETLGSLGRANDQEVDRVRKRNKKLEEEIRVMQDQSYGNGHGAGLQQRIMDEITYLKGKPEILGRPGTGSIEMEEMRRERNDLIEENRRLTAMLKDNKKYDVYLLRKEYEKLEKTLKEYESRDSSGPVSGESRSLKQKIIFYEKTLKSLEKERSELLGRATMAEEQLRSLQENMTRMTQEYQRKIMELKKGGR